MKNRKLPGEDNRWLHIKYAGEQLLKIPEILYSKCLQEGDISNDWNNTIIILQHKTDIKNTGL